jgi:hypothetical protein
MKNDIEPPTRTRLYLVREHRLHGTVTGLEGVKIIASLEDKLDRLLISFKDAKVCFWAYYCGTVLTSSSDSPAGMVRLGP